MTSSRPQNRGLTDLSFDILLVSAPYLSLAKTAAPLVCQQEVIATVVLGYTLILADFTQNYNPNPQKKIFIFVK